MNVDMFILNEILNIITKNLSTSLNIYLLESVHVK